ncbi:MAG: MFS transporter [Streptosporangiaceae bacterium]
MDGATADIMDLIDSSIANLAGPSIRADLGGGQVTVQWMLSAYSAAFALGLVTSGRLGDLLGRRRLFLLGMAGFTLASLACRLAPDVVFLIAARTLQGLHLGLSIAVIGLLALCWSIAHWGAGIAAGLDFLTLPLVGMLPRHAQQAHG